MTSVEGGIDLEFDGWWLAGGPPSGRKVLLSLIDEWVDAYPGDSVTVALPATAPIAVAAALRQKGCAVRTHGRWVSRLPHGLAMLVARRSPSHYRLFQNFSPLRSQPGDAVFVHDAIFVDHPEWFTRSERIYLALIRPLARRVRLVLTSSQAEAARLRRVWPDLAGRVRPVGLSVPRDLTEADQHRPDGIPSDLRFVLTVGRLNVRKNLRRVVNAQASTPAGAPVLVVVGEANGKRDSFGQSGLDPERVIFLGHVTDSELAWLYAHCVGCITASLDEGFGLPVLEAVVAGARVAASDIAPFREISGDLAFFDPSSDDDVRRALLALGAAEWSVARPTAYRSWTPVLRNIRSGLLEILE